MYLKRLLFTLTITLSASMLFATEKHTAEIIGTWQGSGVVFLTHVDKAKFFGEINATLTVQSEDNSTINHLPIVCMTTQKLDLNDSNITASGDCLIGVEKDVIFAAFTCSGPQSDCVGTFTLGGGTGRFNKITGGSEFRSRTQDGTLTIEKGRVLANKKIKGVLIFTDLHYEIPDNK